MNTSKEITINDWRHFFPFPKVRLEQERAINFAIDAFFNKKKRFVICELGVGTGKSATGVAIANYVNAYCSLGAGFTPGAYILTTQKILQEQYLRDFGPGKGLLLSIKSSSNYQCQYYQEQSCAESKRVLSKMGKQLAGTDFAKCCKGSCPYTMDKQAFINSPLSITNFSYFLAETMYAGKLEPRNLLVIDECLRGDAKIWIDKNQEVTIAEIFNNDDITHVMSYNEATDSYERKRIMRRIRTTYDKSTQWYKLSLSTGSDTSELIVTNNHKIWTKNRGYVRADELTTDDVLKFDTLPKENCSRRFVGKRAISKLLDQRKEIIYTCPNCNQTFNTFDYKKHLETIIEIRVCSNENCDNQFEITKSTGPKKYCSHTCYSTSNETRKNRSERMTDENPMFNAQNVETMRVSLKRNWESKSLEQKEIQLTRFKNAPLHENRMKPNRLEQFVLDLCVPSIKFTGLGEKWVTFKNGKHKNPDFIVEGTNKVIEVGDVYFWHTNDEIANVVKSYAEIGYECLYVTNKEIAENPESAKLQIEKFACNHDVKIDSIVKLETPRNWSDDVEHYKYNIEVEDNHNYFANSILVSNCHNTEAELGKFIEVTFSEKFAKDVLKCKVPKLSTQDEVMEWIKKTYKPAVQKYIAGVEKAIESNFISGMSNFGEFTKQYELLDKHICKVNRFINTYDPENWVMNIIKPGEGKRGGRKFEFKPVDVSVYSNDLLFKFGQRVLLMSATIIDKDMFCKTLGIKQEDCEFISIESPFPIENRPVFYVPVGKMSAGDIEATLPNMVEIIKELLKQHANDKGIIHCVDALTPVEMSDGKTKPICELEIGDLVTTWNENEQKFDISPVSAVMNNGERECIELEFDNRQKIICTPDHKILTKNRGWVCAIDLTENDEIADIMHDTYMHALKHTS